MPAPACRVASWILLFGFLKQTSSVLNACAQWYGCGVIYKGLNGINPQNFKPKFFWFGCLARMLLYNIIVGPIRTNVCLPCYFGLVSPKLESWLYGCGRLVACTSSTVTSCQMKSNLNFSWMVQVCTSDRRQTRQCWRRWTIWTGFVYSVNCCLYCVQTDGPSDRSY